MSPSLVVLDCSGPLPATSTPPSSPVPEEGEPTPTEGCSEGEESGPTSISTLVVRTPSPLQSLEAEQIVSKQLEVAIPETAEEAEAQVVEHLTAGRWKAVWSVWRQSRSLRSEPEELQSLSLAEKDLADLTAILDTYCKHMADSREGENQYFPNTRKAHSQFF